MFYNLVNYCLSQRGSRDQEHTSPGGAISIIVSEKLGMEYWRSVPLIEMSIGAKTFILLTRSQKNMAAATVFLALHIQMFLKECSRVFRTTSSTVYRCDVYVLVDVHAAFSCFFGLMDARLSCH